MPRPSKRPLRPRHKAALAIGVLRSWQGGDSVASVAARLGKPEHRVKEALSPAFAAVRCRKGMTADEIAAETGLPRAFVGRAMRAAYGMRDAKRDRERDQDHDSAAVQKATRRYRLVGLSRSEALREARRVWTVSSQSKGPA